MRSPALRSRGVVVALALALVVPAATRAQTKLSGIGDSMMQGANARLSWWPPPGDQIQYSFAQGWSPTVNPLFLRYRSLGLLARGEQFVSVSGAQMVGGGNNAPAQASRICVQATRPDRVVVLLGSNDVCRRSVSTLHAPETFQAALTQALEILGGDGGGSCLPPGAHVHVLTMPAVNFLWEAGREKQSREGVPCQLIWGLADICPIVTRGSDADRAAVAHTIDRYNAAIAAAVAAAQAKYPALRFTTDWTGSMTDAPNTSVGTHRYTGRDLSDIDCFHAKWNTGQRKLACAAWESWESTRFGGSGDVTSCLLQ